MASGFVTFCRRSVGRFACGLLDQLRGTFIIRRNRWILLIMLVCAWLAMDIFASLIVQRIPTVVLDMDNSAISRTIRTYLGAARELDVLDKTVSSVEQAREMMIRGEACAVVVLPSELSSNIKRSRKGEVMVAVDSSNLLLGRNAMKAITKAVATVGAGVQLNVVGKLGERKAHTLARVVPIVIEDHPSFNPSTNYAVYLSPMIVFFLLNLYVIVSAASLYLPKQGPPSTSGRLGAMTGLWLLGTVLGIAFLYGMLPRQHLILQGPDIVAVGMISLWVLADIMMAAAFMSFIPTKVLALEIVIAFATLSMMLSGLTWPTDMFPLPLQHVAAWIPFTPFVQSLTMMLQQPTGLSHVQDHAHRLGFLLLVFTTVAACGAAARETYVYAKAVRRRQA